jgi:Lrp/AsnC family transcriptional regulator, regulator for asnA, asnC and gidA
MVDELDLKIIVEMQRDGRQTNIELAQKSGVVEGTIRKRVRALQDNNFIRIVAVPNLRDLGIRMYQHHSNASPDEVAAQGG